MKLKLNKSVSTIILSILSIALTIGLCLSCYTLYRLRQVNLFSKSINVDNNYFISDDLEDENSDEKVSLETNQDSEKELDINTKKIIHLPYISQEGILPNGCESVSATMLLRKLGFDISPETFVDEYLKCEEMSIRLGCRYGPNPKLAYAGNPRSEENGWGCFAPVIENALNKFLSTEYIVKTLEGMSLEKIQKLYIEKDIPVAVWVTVNMKEIDLILQWQSNDRKETFLYPANEHCMVFMGYDSENYYFADPYNSNGVVKYPKAVAIAAFKSLGSQAVVIES